MKTAFSILLLIVFGAIANFLMVFLLNLSGVPGALVAGTPGNRTKGQFIFGSVVAALGQSYTNLAFTAFIVSWTIAAARRDDVIGLVLWPFAFLAVFIPTHLNLIRARIEARKMEHANAQTEALHLTYIVTLIGFFVFVFVPVIMKAGWGWVPLVPK